MSSDGRCSSCESKSGSQVPIDKSVGSWVRVGGGYRKEFGVE